MKTFFDNDPQQYKCFTIAYVNMKMLQICFSCEFQEHVSNLHKTPRTLSNTINFLPSLRIGAELHSSIFA